jgi:hypothetical protein
MNTEPTIGEIFQLDAEPVKSVRVPEPKRRGNNWWHLFWLIPVTLIAVANGGSSNDTQSVTQSTASCSGGPTGSPDDRLRKGYIALDMSLEQKVLGRSNPAAEHKAAEALVAAGQAGDWCKVHALQDVELARQKASETPEEQADIAAFAHEVTDLANSVGARLLEEQKKLK